MPPLLVLGLGNPLRGDDAAGRCAVRGLLDLASPDIEIREHDGEAADLLARLAGRAAAVLIDCSLSGAPPGHVRRFDLAAGPPPADLRAVSSHGLGLAAALELARALGVLPPRCRVFTVEGESFAIGAPLTPAVAAGVTAMVACIRAELIALLREMDDA
jgi:hydrogenase maturation protease